MCAAFEFGIESLFKHEEKEWSGRKDLNLRPPAPEAGALPGCATPRLVFSINAAVRISMKLFQRQVLLRAGRFFAIDCWKMRFAVNFLCKSMQGSKKARFAGFTSSRAGVMVGSV